jgi:hypothetical protein
MLHHPVPRLMAVLLVPAREAISHGKLLPLSSYMPDRSGRSFIRLTVYRYKPI